MKKKTEDNTKKTDINWIDDKFAILNVRNYSEKLCFFTLLAKSEIGNIMITGCKVVSGSKGDYIAFPSEEYEKDGKKQYKEIANVRFADGIQKMIIDEINKMI